MEDIILNTDIINDIGCDYLNNNYVNEIISTKAPTEAIEKNEIEDYGKNDRKSTALSSEEKRKRRKIVNRNNYLKNKERLRLNKLINREKCNQRLCSCGAIWCDLNNEDIYLSYKTIKPHTKLLSHKLFKSFIAIIHSRRKNRNIKSIINRLNREWIGFKTKDWREIDDGKMSRTISKTDKNIIIHYQRRIDANIYDENLYPEIREPNIDAVKYSAVGKCRVNLLRARQVVCGNKIIRD